MVYRKRLPVVIFILLLLTVPVSGEENPAATGLAFLKLGAGARAVGMGETFTSLADDPSAVYWNPAGLAIISGAHLLFTHNEWLQDIRHEFLAVNFHIGKNAFGIGLMTSSVSGIERRVAPTAEPLGEFGAHDVMLGISYARKLKPSLSVGATAKFLYQKIYIEESSGVALDLGVRYQTHLPGLYAGAALQNFGYTSKLKTEAPKLPQTARIGIAYQLDAEQLQGKLIFAADVVQIFESTAHLNLGAEYDLKNLFQLRLGYQTGYQDKGIHAGFGVGFLRYRLDYAFVPFSAGLGNTHRIAFGIKL